MFRIAGVNARFLGGGLVALGGLVLAGCGGEQDEAAPAVGAASPTADVAAAGPSGTIVFEVTGKGYFAAPADRPSLAAETKWSAPERGGFATAPNGRYFAFAMRDERGVALVVGWPGGTTDLARLAEPNDPALIEGKGEAASVGGVPLVIAWSPDSQRVAFGTLKLPFVLTIAERTSGGEWRLSEHRVAGGYIGELAWAPGGSTLAVSTYSLDRKDHTVFVLGLDGGGPRRLVDGCRIAWSPDGRYVVVHRDSPTEPGTWIVSIDGAERFAVTTEPKSYPVAWRG